jgi:hypothetical protein
MSMPLLRPFAMQLSMLYELLMRILFKHVGRKHLVFSNIDRLCCCTARGPNVLFFLRLGVRQVSRTR